MVDLRVAEALTKPRLATIDRDREPLIVRDDLAVGIRRIDPDIMMITAGRFLPLRRDERAAAVDRPGEARRQEVQLVVVVGCDSRARVVVRAAHRVAVARHQLPRRAIIIGAPQLPVLSGRAIPRQTVAGFDEREDARRIRPRDRQRVFAGHTRRQSVASQLSPGDAAIGALVKSTTGTAA